MRVLFDIFRDGLFAINSASDKLATAQQQVATGKRIHTISDDPQAVRQAVGEHATLGALDAYTRSADSATARLLAADSVLSSIVDKISAAIVSGTAARGSNVTAAARDAHAAELRSLRDGLLNDFNASVSGTYLFSGTEVTTPAFANVGGVWTYQGNGGTAQVEVERGRLINVSFDGRAIAQGGDAADVFTVIDDLAAAIEAGDSDAMAAGIDALDRAFDRALQAQGRLGADERAVYDASARLADLRLAAAGRRSKLEDANMAEAVTRLQQADTAYRAALSAVSTSERVSLLDFLR
jgi:flagellar hook-associated protein 3 FlgL